MPNDNGKGVGCLAVIAVFVLFSVTRTMMGCNNDDHDDAYERQRQHEKAEFMRAHGAEGSDRTLSESYDKVKQLVEQEKRRRTPP